MISIVIPVYNAASFLADMLDSIVYQSYNDYEIILVNDGSTDESSAICHKYALQYKNITVFDRQNYGAAASRNFGIEKAQGEFIWFMDSDDVLEEDALLRAIEMQKESDADVVIGGMNFCFTDTGRISTKVLSRNIVLDSEGFKEQYKELFSINYVSSLCNKMFRREIVCRNNIRLHESLQMYEDYIFCMDILLKCKVIACSSSVFYNYELRNTLSLSHRHKSDVLSMFSILENKISGYLQVFGEKSCSGKSSLNNLIVYLGYECVKNEAKGKNSYAKVRELLHAELFHHAMCNYNATGKKHKVVQYMMKYKQTLLLLAYLKINRKA